jgi:RimJ/RimL family protein N-acetyltransferase
LRSSPRHGTPELRVLTTPRLRLLPWEARFEDDLIRLSSDPRVTRYLGDGRPWDRAFAVQRHRAHLAHWREHGYGWRAITSGGDGQVLGVAALTRLGTMVPGLDESSIDIGWWVAPSHWGQGIATEAATAIRDEAFTDLGAELLVARYQPTNEASGRIMVKLGMSHHSDITGRAGEHVRVYILTRTTWASTR